LIRLMLSDAQWERIAPKLSGKPGDRGCRGRDNRLFIEAVLWIAPAPHGVICQKTSAIGSPYIRASGAGRRRGLGSTFSKLCDDPDFEYVLIDGPLVRVHQHGTGAVFVSQGLAKSVHASTTELS
jgi:putative transposase